MQINKKIIISGVILGIVLVLAIFFFWNMGKSEKVYHVGILSGLDAFANTAEGFKAKMTQLGYVEGENIVYDLQKTNYEPEKEKQILQKFVEDKVDLIFGFNTEVALAAKEAAKGTGIPIVFANSFLEGSNLVDSIKQPGGDITGVRYPGIDVAVKRLEVMHEIAPQASVFWLPYQKGYPAVSSELEILRPAAKSLNITLIEFASENLTHLQTELETRSKSESLGFDAVLFIPESLSTTKAAFEIVANYTREKKIPVGGSSIVTSDYGTVFAVTINSAQLGEMAAISADKILKGTPAGTIPVTSPETVLKINYKVAQELGLNVSEGLLSRADEIIK
jgi:putative tryptophan/tyrosine transport system substrate-binding protein